MSGRELMTGEMCVKCGLCEAVCPSRLSSLRSLDLDRSGVLPEEIVNCTTCNRCVASCPRNVPITKAIERMRRSLTTPGYGETLANISTYGTSIVPSSPCNVDVKSCKVAYFAGCLTNHRLRDIGAAVEYTLDYLGIEYTRIPEVCCGSPLNRIGRFDLARKMLEKNLAMLRAQGVETVITSCPGCTSTLLEYQDEFEILHYLDLYDRHRMYADVSRDDLVATLQFPCHLYRNVSPYTMVVAEQILSAMYDYRRLPEADRCCGAGGGVRRNDLALSRQLKARKVDDIRALAPDIVITTCPQCKVHLSEDVPGIEDLSVVLAKALGFNGK
ncbi:(Fe-S)-binding protein [Methanocella sp. MCL-LM]|uniref:(Fe-S)-binding protein n=1 Tax=Methanocella sp. MCL-LM TaxID=3412035 RepID=UPI003C75DB9B